MLRFLSASAVHRFGVICAILASLAARPVAAQSPKLTSVSPLSVAPGQSTQVTLLGTDLAKPTALWSTFGESAQWELGDGAKNGTAKDRVTYKVTVAKGTPSGLYGLRLATGEGISNVRTLFVDELPTITQQANTSLTTAQELQLPVGVEGNCTAEVFHYFKLRATAGQRVAIDVWARRLGSPLDPVVRVIDSTGRDVAYSDDDEASGADSRCAFLAASDGEYLVELRDIRYQGGANHRFRLRVGDLPLVSVPYPLAAPKGGKTQLQLLGAAHEPTLTAEVAVPGDSAAAQITVDARSPKGQASTPIMVATSTATEQLEFEPNDTRETATAIDVTGAINGRFDQPKDRDYFGFTCKKGERFVFQGKTRSLGVPSDLLLRIVDAQGKQIVEADDAGLEEGTLDFTAPADGAYALVVEELLGRGGAYHVYRVEMSPFRPGFTLALDTDTKAKLEAEPFNAPIEGAFLTKVTCQRQGYTGEITLSVTGWPADIDPKSVRYRGNIIAEGKNDAVLICMLPKSLQQGTYFPIRVVGTATIDKQVVKVEASTINHLRAQLNGVNVPPAGLDGFAMLAVARPYPDFFKLTAADAAVIPQLVGSGSVKIKIEKLNKFDDKVTLDVQGLPPGYKAKEVAIEKGKAEAVIELTGPANTVEGEWPVKVVAQATHLNQPKTVVLDVPLKIVRPLSLTASLSADAAKPALTVKIARAAGVTGEVKLTAASLPAGVQATEVTIPADKSEATIPLKLGQLSPSLEPNEIVVRGTIALKSRPYRAESEPIAWVAPVKK